jgi:hypothetical protein
MDPVAIGAVLAAIAGGVGEGLAASCGPGFALVRRPFNHRPGPQRGAVVDG